MCKDVSVLGSGSIVRYFLGIVDILEFCDFMIFHSRHNTMILKSYIRFSEQ